jgi:periplasmic mercuric ion binding protein
MKTFQLFIALLFISFTAVAQDKTDKIKVSGECGMCKSKIEKAAKSAGASYALWDVEKKELTVTYNNSSSNAAKIEKAIAAVGYDTQNEKATTEAYNKLHECCKYERTSANEAKANCCADCKDGKCTSEKCADCCKDGKCTKNMDCCKDGKCEMHSEASHSAKTEGKSCCKKS